MLVYILLFSYILLRSLFMAFRLYIFSGVEIRCCCYCYYYDYFFVIKIIVIIVSIISVLAIIIIIIVSFSINYNPDIFFRLYICLFNLLIYILKGLLFLAFGLFTFSIFLKVCNSS